MTELIDTNVVVRHLTGDQRELAVRATRLLRESDELLLSDVVVAETAFVLESHYELSRERIAGLLRTLVVLPSVRVLSVALLLRTLELYELFLIGFVDSYLIASAELTETRLATFDGRLATLFPAVAAAPA